MCLEVTHRVSTETELQLLIGAPHHAAASICNADVVAY